jgi:hypothetical protein
VSDVITPLKSGPKTAELDVRQRPEMKVLHLSGYGDESVVGHGPLGPGRRVRESQDGVEE